MTEDDLDHMAMPDRARHYRDMAEEAINAAESAQDNDVREEFMRLAQGWHALAMQMELAVSGHMPEWQENLRAG